MEKKGKISRLEIKGKKAVLDKNSCLAQNIVAHIANPIDHIKITSTVPLERNFTILDTVNQVICKEISPLMKNL